MSDFKIPYGKQYITESDINAVTEVLKQDYLTQGPKILEFEKAFAEYVDAKYAVAVSNGTAALHLNCLALDLKPGQKVITTPITFSASANCIRYCGAEVIFADIDPKTFLIDLDNVERILENSKEGEIVGIIPVDFAGRAVDMERVLNLSNKYDLWIIEDACHAPGGYFIDSKGNQNKCGNGKYADLAIFSFHPVKHIASGEGGMITTNDKNLYEKLLSLRTHGITRDHTVYTNSKSEAFGLETTHTNMGEQWPGWYMEMQDLGYNYRLTDIQAALGLSQLSRAENGLEKRRQIAERYTDELSDIKGIINCSNVVEGHAYHLYVLVVEDRNALYEFLREKGIFTQIHYIPVHLMPYYKSLGFRKGDFPKAEKYYSKCISIPMFPTITEEELTFVIYSIKSFYNK